MKTYEQVYKFWFGDANFSQPDYGKNRNKLWFGKDVNVDEEMREKFGGLLTQPPDPQLQRWKVDRKGMVSLVVLHDQFPRNIYRGTAKMYAWDDFALAQAKEALGQGVHESMSIFEAMFLILPFEHSEKLSDQQESVQLFSDLRNRCPLDLQSFGDDILNYAIRHQNIVEEFGRFPHRNEILGRKSTPREVEFLQSPGSGF